MSQVEPTIARCQAIIRDKRNSRHPFVADLAKPYPLHRLSRWATQKYHQVYRQNGVFSNIHANTFERDVREWMVEQLIAEETPFTSGSASHYELMQRFAQRCGAADESFAPGAVAAPVKTYVDLLLSRTRNEHFVLGLVAVYAIEAQSGESVGKLLGWLRRHYDFSDHDLEWFVVHSDDEDAHASRGLNLVRKYAETVDGFADAAPRVVGEICDGWLRLHDFYRDLVTAEP